MGNKKKPLQRCPFSHEDCFSLIAVGHLCYCLQDTSFEPGRDCPFYKPESKVEPKYIAMKYLTEDDDEREEELP